MKNVFAALFLLLLVCPASAQDVIRVDRDGAGDRPLSERFDQAGNAMSGTEGWIGFSVTRMMRENSVMGRFVGEWRSSPTIEELLDPAAAPDEPSVEQTAKEALDEISRREAGKPERLVPKRMAVLIRMNADGRIRDVAYSNTSMAFDADGIPIYWTGHADNDEAFELLARLYDKHRSDGVDVGEDLISAIGLLDASEVHDWLFDIVQSDRPADEREQAVFWLGESDDPRFVDELYGLADDDPSEDVREQAVFALFRMKSDASVVRLVDLARSAEHETTVEKARFWLAQRAGNRLVVGTNTSEPSDLEKQAVFALSRLENGQAVEELAVVARSHRNPHIRKQALFWLGERGDEESLAVILDVLEGGR